MVEEYVAVSTKGLKVSLGTFSRIEPVMVLTLTFLKQRALF